MYEKKHVCVCVCVSRRYPDAKVINFGTWFIFSFPIALVMLLLTWLWLHCLFLGCKWAPFWVFLSPLRGERICVTVLSRLCFSFRETCSLSKKRKTKRETMSERRIQEEYAKLGPVRCRLLLRRFEGVIRRGFTTLFFCVCVSPNAPQLSRGGDGRLLHPDDRAVVHQRARVRAGLDVPV